MKKITIVLSMLLGTTAVNAQLFTDGFEAGEGYAVNDYIGNGPNSASWGTWSGTGAGTAEDAQVSDAQANTGSNSIYFLAVGAGGPQDVILDFGQQYVDGIFTYESAFYVPSGKTAYFNFQGTPIVATTWAMNCNMINGMVTIDDGGAATLATGAYAEDTWFTLRIEANLSTGRWQGWIDGVCFGVWNNQTNEVASLDLYPTANGEFYVDDVMFDHTAYVTPNLNAAVAGFDMGVNLAGVDVYPKVTVANAGTVAISSFDVTVDYNGTPYVENVTGQNLLTGQTMEVAFTAPITLVAGSNPATATVSNVNGGNDDDASDDDGCAVIDPVIPAVGKMVVGEEGTGTWCGWCPRGAVYMDKFENDFGDYWAGIAVHNGASDPMTLEPYDTPFSALIGGYPSALVDRGTDVNPAAMGPDFYDRIAIDPAAMMTNGATWDPTTRELVVSVTAEFTMAGNDNYKMMCVLTEDGISGTTAGYNQANYYSGGGNGEMGGYELLADPVPAAQMVYDHVARGITSFLGENTCFPATIAIGDSVTNQYVFTLPAEWDENNMHIVGILVDPSGRFDNAASTSITEAVNNGLEDACSISLGDMIATAGDVFLIYPNPADESTTVEINLANDSKVELSVLDMSGKVIQSANYGLMSSSSLVNINTSGLESGVYLIQLSVNGEKMTKRLIVK